jgi:hypothetical protein
MLSKAQFGGVHQLLAQGGYTVDPETGRVHREGWSVSDPDDEATRPMARTTPRTIEAYHRLKAVQLAQPAAKSGGWLNPRTQEATFDVSKVYPDQRTARGYMAMHGQEAAYNLKTGQTVYNPLHPENHPLKTGLIPPENRRRVRVRRI